MTTISFAIVLFKSMIYIESGSTDPYFNFGLEYYLITEKMLHYHQTILQNMVLQILEILHSHQM